jgi:hypothetical protein
MGSQGKAAIFIRERLADGRAEGEAKGRAQSLAHLLTRRFGPLPEAVQRRIEKADRATLDRGLDRVLDAPDLDSVLAGRRKSPG